MDGRYFFRVLPRLVTVPPPGMAPCAVGSIVEVLVSATGNNYIHFNKCRNVCRKFQYFSVEPFDGFDIIFTII